MHVGQAAVKPVVIPGELFMIEAQEMEDGGVKIPNGCGVDGGAPAEFIRGPVTGRAP